METPIVLSREQLEHIYEQVKLIKAQEEQAKVELYVDKYTTQDYVIDYTAQRLVPLKSF